MTGVVLSLTRTPFRGEFNWAGRFLGMPAARPLEKVQWRTSRWEANTAGQPVEVQNAIPSSARLIVDGVVTLAMVILAFLVFDDITTDNATRFAVEYSCLLACAIWRLVLVIRLAGTRHFVLGGASALVLGAAVWGQPAIGPGATPSWQPEYVAVVAAVGWFLVLSLLLIVSGVRCDRRDHRLAR